MTDLELLAPARDIETAIAAINCGADAVYIGGPHHGARAAAANSINDIAALCSYAHRFRVKVYVTFNTLIYDNEIYDVPDTVRELYRAGVDALIIQDMGMLRMDLPPIALHASTQCDTRTVQQAIFLEKAGMSCIVLPRELSIQEIREISKCVSARLEAFVHGALCVCYSGDCRASFVNGGRSANRGECAQICRLPYDLTDSDGNVLIADRHFLSLRDMNRLDRLSELADAGVSSFKIEGRLKDKAYVMNTVAAYSAALDTLAALNPTRYRRASRGTSKVGFTADVTRSFNRGFTDYFCSGEKPAPNSLASMRTPKWIGRPIGTVTAVKGRTITVKPAEDIHNADGLSFFDSSGRFTGFRVNKAEKRGNSTQIQTQMPVDICPGTELFRNYDKTFDDCLASARPQRSISVEMTLSALSDGIALEITDERGCRAKVATTCPRQKAQKPQAEVRRTQLSRLGDTIYNLEKLTDNLEDRFIPASVIADIRRKAIDALDHAAAATYRYDYRRPEDLSASLPHSAHLTFHANVANKDAQLFYKDHGATQIDDALEVSGAPTDREVNVMTSRYCLRRELGACLREKSHARRLPSGLILRPHNPSIRPMRMDCDCTRCIMNLVALPLAGK